jgi:hypothetical protein
VGALQSLCSSEQLGCEHVAQLPVTLLASAHAAMELQAANRLQLVAVAAEAVHQLCSKSELDWLSSEQLQQQHSRSRQLLSCWSVRVAGG